MANERAVALRILYKIEFEGAFSNIAIDEVLQAEELDRRGAGFVTQLVYGVISHKLTLDYVIGCYSSVKIKKLSKYVLLILRLSIYQIMYCDKVPQSAAVNEGVKLSAKYANKSRGFVNGVLRSISREANGQEWFLDNKPIGDKYLLQSVKYSFPQEICKMWSERYGYDKASDIMESLNATPSVSACINAMRGDMASVINAIENEGGVATPNKVFDGTIDISGVSLSKSKAFADGLFHIQDPAASLAARVLDPKAGECILDACAAPGGKSVLIAELMSDVGQVIACDIYDHKIKLISQNATRLGLKTIQPVINDATMPNKDFSEAFDRVLVDAPCSGFGIIRRKPEIKYHMTERGKMAALQYDILSTNAKYVKPGGVLVYSTCTIEPIENEDIINRFLKENKNFVCEDITPYIPTALQSETTKNGYVTILPGISDGFFIAKLKKND